MINKKSCSSYYEVRNNATLEAKDVFLKALPNDWISQQYRYNHDIDYTITINDNKSKKIVFQALIKHANSFKKQSSSYSISLKTTLLKKCQSIKKPVFLILVDVENQNIYWLLLQKHIEEIEERKPSWHNQKTISVKIPIVNIWDNHKSFKKAVISGHKYVHLLQYKLSYMNISHKLKSYTVASNVNTSTCTCNDNCNSESCSTNIISDEYNLSDIQIENSLKMANTKNIKDLKENREAYEHISDALEQAGYNASPNLHYMAAVEKHYYNIIYYMMRFFGNNSNKSNFDEQCLLDNLEKLTNTVTSSIDKGEVTTSATLMLRMADVYNNAFSYLFGSFDSKKTFSLLDYAHSLLEMADNMATSIEVPEQVLQ